MEKESKIKFDTIYLFYNDVNYELINSCIIKINKCVY